MTPDKGKAVDTIKIDDAAYVNNGVVQPPKDSRWTSIVVNPVSKAHKVMITLSDCSDDSDVPDKYRHKVKE